MGVVCFPNIGNTARQNGTLGVYNIQGGFGTSFDFEFIGIEAVMVDYLYSWKSNRRYII